MQPKRFWLTVAAIAALVGGYFFIDGVFTGLPSLEELENPRPPLATRVYSADGELIDKFFEENRSRISTLDSVPKAFLDALLATEDTRFFEHWGVDLRAVARVILLNLSKFTLRGPGGSTLTQQLARKLYLSDEVTIVRKLREMVTAVQIERRYTKDEILLMYVNVVPFGRGAYGLQAAAQEYFAKAPSQLTLGECAFLVGLLQNPTRYDPRRHYDRAITRRNVVLLRMEDEGFIPRGMFEARRYDSIVTRSRVRSAGIAPHFVEYVRQQLREKAEKHKFNLYRDGLTVFSTLDSRMQESANRAVREHLSTFQTTFSAHWNWETPQRRALLAGAITIAARQTPEYQSARTADARELALIRCRRNQYFVDSVKAALTRIQVGFAAIDPSTGQIRAMVGNSEMDFRYGLNHCTQIERQPGSTFKPFVYTVAIDNGYTPAFQLPNEPIGISDGSGRRWSPKNFGGETGGMYTLRRGLMLSVNLVAIRAMLEIAPAEEVVRYAHRMGLTSNLRPYPSLAIGTSEVIPLEMISAYGAYANEGILAKPRAILRIEDRDGRVIEEDPGEFREVLSKETAFIMTSMMRSVVTSGTGAATRAWYAGPAAGKTGTTQDYADAWFVGFTPNLVAGAWTGFDDRRITFTGSYGQGSVAAAPIWARFMKYVYGDRRIKLPIADFTLPPGVIQEHICLDSQSIATSFCPSIVTEFVNKKYMPGVCTVHTSGGGSRKRESVIEY